MPLLAGWYFVQIRNRPLRWVFMGGQRPWLREYRLELSPTQTLRHIPLGATWTSKHSSLGRGMTSGGGWVI